MFHVKMIEPILQPKPSKCAEINTNLYTNLLLITCLFFVILPLFLTYFFNPALLYFC